MDSNRLVKTESFLLFLPFAILAFAGTISATIIVYLCFACQFLSLLFFYLINRRLIIGSAWKRKLSIVVCLYVLSVICSALGYSPSNSIRVTTLVYLNITFLLVTMACSEADSEKLFTGFVYWCSVLCYMSVIFSVLGLLIGSAFQLIVINDNAILFSNVRLGLITLKQYAVRGGLVNGNLGVASWFTNPNTFSMICLISYINCLYNKQRVGLLISLLGIILGFSRAILIMTILVTFLLFYQSSNKVLKVALIFCVIASTGAIIFAGYLQLPNFNGRMSMWKVLMQYAIKHHFFPNGLGTSSLILKEYGGISLSAHSLYMNILVEYGLFGILFFVLFTVQFVQYLLVTAKKEVSNSTKKNYKIEFATFASLLLLGMTEVTAFTFSFFNYLFFFVVFTVYGRDISNDNSIYANI